MKKQIIPLILATSLLTLFSSCSKTEATNPETKTEIDTLKNSQPEKRADIQWTVKSIVGNDFTIETIDIESSEVLKQMQDPEFRTKMQAMTDTERQAFMTKMQEARTSAKKVLIEVTIPVGVPILMRTGGGFGGGAGGQFRWWAGGPRATGGIGSSLNAWANPTTTAPTSKQGTIADIKVGGTVSLWLTENTGDRKIASWVSLTAGGSGGAPGGGFGGGPGGGFGGGPVPTNR